MAFNATVLPPEFSQNHAPMIGLAEFDDLLTSAYGYVIDSSVTYTEYTKLARNSNNNMLAMQELYEKLGGPAGGALRVYPGTFGTLCSRLPKQFQQYSFFHPLMKDENFSTLSMCITESVSTIMEYGGLIYDAKNVMFVVPKVEFCGIKELLNRHTEYCQGEDFLSSIWTVFNRISHLDRRQWRDLRDVAMMQLNDLTQKIASLESKPHEVIEYHNEHSW